MEVSDISLFPFLWNGPSCKDKWYVIFGDFKKKLQLQNKHKDYKLLSTQQKKIAHVEYSL